MNKMIFRTAVICFSCLLMITGIAIADKPEWAGRPELTDEKRIEWEAEKAKREVAKELRNADWEAGRSGRKTEREAKKAKKKSKEEVAQS